MTAERKEPGLRAARKEARPREILEAAFEEFLQKGYAATRLDDIAARIGVTKGTIYIYFENKERLFEAMVGELSQPVVDSRRYERALDDAAAFDVIALFLTDLYAVAVHHHYTREIVRFLIAEGRTFEDLMDRHRHSFVEPTFAVLTKIMERGYQRNEFRTNGQEYAASFLLSPMLAATIMGTVLLDETFDPDVYRQNHLDMLRRILI